MDVTLVGCGPADTLMPGQVVRATFTERYSIMLDSGFAGKFSGVYDALKASGMMNPLSPNAAVQGNVVAVEDIQVTAVTDVAEVLANLDSLCGWFVRVMRLELLDGGDAANSQGADGIAARNQLAAEGEKQAQTEGTLHKIADGLGVAAGTLKWLAIAAVVIGLLIVAARARDLAGASLK